MAHGRQYTSSLPSPRHPHTHGPGGYPTADLASSSTQGHPNIRVKQRDIVHLSKDDQILRYLKDLMARMDALESTQTDWMQHVERRVSDVARLVVAGNSCLQQAATSKPRAPASSGPRDADGERRSNERPTPTPTPAPPHDPLQAIMNVVADSSSALEPVDPAAPVITIGTPSAVTPLHSPKPTLPLNLPSTPGGGNRGARSEVAVPCVNNKQGICTNFCCCKEMKAYQLLSPKSAPSANDTTARSLTSLCSPSTLDNEDDGLDPDREEELLEMEHRAFESRVLKAERDLSATELLRPDEWVFSPDGVWRRSLDCLYLCVTLCEFVAFGFAVLQPDTDAVRAAVACTSCGFHAFFALVDAHTAVLTGYTLEDRSVTLLRTRYIKGWMAFDVLTALPYDLLFVHYPWSRYFGAPRALHAGRVSTLFQSANPLKEEHTGWTTAWRAVFWSCWCINLIGVSFILIADEQSIVKDSTATDLDTFDRYLDGIYWAAVTLSSVGYGDIVPETRWAKLFSLPMTLLSVLVLSFLTGQVASSVIRLDAFQQNLKEKKAKLYSLMDRYAVPWEVQKGAFNIYPVILETSLKDYFEVLRDLPPFMQDQVILCIKRKIVSQVPLFRFVDTKTLTALAIVMKQQLMGPCEYIIVEGDIGNEMFFIAQGVVEVLITNDLGEECCAATLKSGSWFGEIALINRVVRTASVRSVTSCSCFKLGAKEFGSILRMYPGLEERIRGSVNERVGCTEGLRRRSEAFKGGMQPVDEPGIEPTEKSDNPLISSKPSDSGTAYNKTSLDQSSVSRAPNDNPSSVCLEGRSSHSHAQQATVTEDTFNLDRVIPLPPGKAFQGNARWDQASSLGRSQISKTTRSQPSTVHTRTSQRGSSRSDPLTPTFSPVPVPLAMPPFPGAQVLGSPAAEAQQFDSFQPSDRQGT